MGMELFADPRPNALRGSWTASPERVASLIADSEIRSLDPVVPV